MLQVDGASYYCLTEHDVHRGINIHPIGSKEYFMIINSSSYEESYDENILYKGNIVYTTLDGQAGNLVVVPS